MPLGTPDHPDFLFRIAFASNPDASSPIWSTVTQDLLEWSMRRGKNREDDESEGGTQTWLLDNFNRQYEPKYAGGANYPNVKRGKRGNARATYNSTTYDLATGFAADWPLDYDGRLAEASVPFNDAFARLEKVDISGFRPLELSSARINWILDQVGIPAADRAIDTGKSDVESSWSAAGTLLEGVPALQHLLDVVDAELGWFFVNGAGQLVFHHRHKRLAAPYMTPQATFSDDPGAGEKLYIDIEPRLSEVFNDISVKPIAAETAATSTDAASVLEYGKSTHPQRDLWITTLGEAQADADYLVQLWKDEKWRFDSITIDPMRDPAVLWPLVLGYEIGTRIAVEWTPPSGGTAVLQEVHIEAIEHNLTGLREGRFEWRTKWMLTPADPARTYWTLGDAVEGLLGVTTDLAW